MTDKTHKTARSFALMAAIVGAGMLAAASTTPADAFSAGISVASSASATTSLAADHVVDVKAKSNRRKPRIKSVRRTRGDNLIGQIGYGGCIVTYEKWGPVRYETHCPY